MSRVDPIKKEVQQLINNFHDETEGGIKTVSVSLFGCMPVKPGFLSNLSVVLVRESGLKNCHYKERAGSGGG